MDFKVFLMPRIPSVTIECSSIPRWRISVRLPEALDSIIDPFQDWNFVTDAKWEWLGDNKLGYDNHSTVQHGNIARHYNMKGSLSLRVNIQDDCMRFDFSLKNLDEVEWKAIYAWVCVGYREELMTPGKIKAEISNKSYVLSQEKDFVPYEELDLKHFGPAGQRCLTPLGEDWRMKLEESGIKSKVPKQSLFMPIRATTGQVDGEKLAIGLISPKGVVLGGFDKNPCIDMGLGFGDIKPREEVKNWGAVCFIKGTLDDLKKVFDQLLSIGSN